jgi:isopenicillin N synthase-like dioxygenase
MSTSFSSLPIVSLSALSSSSPKLGELATLAARLDEVFSTTGFAYLTDLPLTYSHEDVFGLCDDFFGANGLSVEEKMKLAKKTFVKTNANTYRGLSLVSLSTIARLTRLPDISLLKLVLITSKKALNSAVLLAYL